MSFFTEIDADCWAGTLSPFEQRLLQSLPAYALEQLRTRFIHAVTDPREPAKAARSILQMAFETEIGTALTKLIVIAPDVQKSRICERRRYLEIDQDMRMFKFLWTPALEALNQDNTVPSKYIELLEQHFGAEYPRYRVCALAALLCMAAFYLTEAA